MPQAGKLRHGDKTQLRALFHESYHGKMLSKEEALSEEGLFTPLVLNFASSPSSITSVLLGQNI